LKRLAAVLGCLVLLGLPAFAHELRPAYLDMREVAPHEFAVLWKVPANGEMRLSLYVQLPEICQPKTEPARSIEAGAYLERWTAACNGDMAGQEIRIDGLRGTMTDALVRIAYEQGTMETVRLTPAQPSFVVAGVQSRLDVAVTYFRLGADHIFSGIDHLLFVFALLLLIHDRWMLLKTITAFTIAHSITLSGAALGYLSLPQKPVEAIIALSIAFVARELIKSNSRERRLSERFPWIVAFSFGLLHGFGFAGALKEIGLPQADVPIALLTFNLGVEAGQLVFVAGVMLAWRAITVLVEVDWTYARSAAAYLIGVLATIWLLERLAAFVA
jgi:hydrogenase/urease accessory protein HupE